MIEQQLQELRERLALKSKVSVLTTEQLPNGAVLIKVSNVDLIEGWNRSLTDVLFVAPPGYPNAAPDCFWVQPGGLRLANGATPQASNDSNPIPGDPTHGRNTTWFSWHVRGWNPNVDTVTSFYHLILARLRPAR